MKITACLFMVLCLMLFTSSAAFAAGDAKAGGELFAKKCRACHGADGNPNPAMAKKGVKPMGGPEVQKMTDAELTKDIKEAASHKALVKTITDTDVVNLIAFIRTLKK